MLQVCRCACLGGPQSTLLARVATQPLQEDTCLFLDLHTEKVSCGVRAYSAVVIIVIIIIVIVIVIIIVIVIVIGIVIVVLLHLFKASL